MKKYHSIKFGSTILLFSVFVYFSPFISVFQFTKSLDNEIPEKVNQFIDYPSLRKSLSPQFSILLSRYLSINYPSFDNTFISNLILTPLSKKLIDSTLNPRSVTSILRLRNKLFSESSNSPNKISSNIVPIKIAFPEISFAYKDPNTFTLSSYFAKNSYRVITKWKRYNLINWQLIGIELPLDEISLSQIVDSIKTENSSQYLKID